MASLLATSAHASLTLPSSSLSPPPPLPSSHLPSPHLSPLSLNSVADAQTVGLECRGADTLKKGLTGVAKFNATVKLLTCAAEQVQYYKCFWTNYLRSRIFLPDCAYSVVPGGAAIPTSTTSWTRMTNMGIQEQLIATQLSKPLFDIISEPLKAGCRYCDRTCASCSTRTFPFACDTSCATNPFGM